MEDIINNNDIIKLCDEWLSQFYKCYDKLEEYVVSKREKYNNTLNVEISLFNSSSNSGFDNKNTKIYGIRLDMVNNETPIIEGPSIVLPKNQKSIYKYLLLNIFSYYINKNYKKTILDNWHGILCEDLEEKRRKKEKTRPLDSFRVLVLCMAEEKKVGMYRAYFNAKIFYNEFKKDLDEIVQRHNYGINSISDIIYELKSNELLVIELSNIEELKLEQSKRKSQKVIELVTDSKKKTKKIK